MGAKQVSEGRCSGNACGVPGLGLQQLSLRVGLDVHAASGASLEGWSHVLLGQALPLSSAQASQGASHPRSRTSCVEANSGVWGWWWWGVLPSGLTDTSQLDENDPWTPPPRQIVTFPLVAYPSSNGPSSWKLSFFLLHLFGCTGSQLRHAGYLLLQAGPSVAAYVSSSSLPKARTCAPLHGERAVLTNGPPGKPRPHLLTSSFGEHFRLESGAPRFLPSRPQPPQS